eukprot:39791-Pelagomonas_calceolata.AAC.1
MGGADACDRASVQVRGAGVEPCRKRVPVRSSPSWGARIPSFTFDCSPLIPLHSGIHREIRR